MRSLFADGSAEAHEELTAAVLDVVMALEAANAAADGPFPSASTSGLEQAIGALDPLPDDATPFAEVITEVAKHVLVHSARPAHPWCAAHLHSPTLLHAAATELAIGVTNQSMDSFDQAPAATFLEDRLIERLAAVLGLPPTSSGVMTSGGTASNLVGLFLARENATDGRRVIVTSQAAHVSVRQAARVLGLGAGAVVAVSTDAADRIDLAELDTVLAEHDPMAIVGTAGTTDAGAIDALDALADRAAAHGAWLHVDAAVGAAFTLSDRLRPRLAGLDRADSITADLHKLWWQPIGASALLVRDAATMQGLREPADYLNRPEDTGVLNLVDRSLDTSRRFDALKVVVSLRTVGRRRLATMVEHLVELTQHAGRLVADHPGLELLRTPQTITVLFRCAGVPDDANVAVQRALLAQGTAVIGRTTVFGRVALKLTLVNPLATHDDVAGLLNLIAKEAR